MNNDIVNDVNEFQHLINKEEIKVLSLEEISEKLEYFEMLIDYLYFRVNVIEDDLEGASYGSKVRKLQRQIDSEIDKVMKKRKKLDE